MVDLGVRTIVLTLLLAFCLSAGLPADQVEAAAESAAVEYTLIPVSIMFVPSIGLPPSRRYRTETIVALNFGAGYTDRLSGAGAGIITLVGEDAVGAMAGVGNYVGGNLTGVQSGVVNVTVGGMRGAQSGVVNLNLESSEGLQAAVVNVSGRDLRGVQTGVTNFVFGQLKGVQAGVVNFAGSGTGAQFGVVNVAGRARGLQAGLVNISRELDGVPLGLINIVMEGGLTHGQVYYDELGSINAALLHGSRWVYNVYTLGIDQNQEWWTGGIGLGVHLPAGRSYLNIEATTSGVLQAGRWEGAEQTLVHRARVYAGARIARRAAVFAGASFNYAAAVDGGVPDLPPVLHGFEFPFSSERHRFWPGLFAGVEF
jgi:hypothetical protein